MSLIKVLTGLGAIVIECLAHLYGPRPSALTRSYHITDYDTNIIWPLPEFQEEPCYNYLRAKYNYYHIKNKNPKKTYFLISYFTTVQGFFWPIVLYKFNKDVIIHE